MLFRSVGDFFDFTCYKERRRRDVRKGVLKVSLEFCSSIREKQLSYNPNLRHNPNTNANLATLIRIQQVSTYLESWIKCEHTRLKDIKVTMYTHVFKYNKNNNSCILISRQLHNLRNGNDLYSLSIA